MEKILFERLRSVLLHQDLSVIKHNLLKRRKCFGFCFILLTFPAHGKLTIVKTCGVSTQSPCSDRSELLITMQWKGKLHLLNSPQNKSVRVGWFYCISSSTEFSLWTDECDRRSDEDSYTCMTCCTGQQCNAAISFTPTTLLLKLSSLLSLFYSLSWN